jgi:hypothetical protein
MVGNATLWAVLIDLMDFSPSTILQTCRTTVTYDDSVSTLLPTPGMRAAPWGCRTGIRAYSRRLRPTFFFHLDVPEFLAQATASDIFGRYRQGVPLVPARFIIGVRQ